MYRVNVAKSAGHSVSGDSRSMKKERKKHSYPQPPPPLTISNRHSEVEPDDSDDMQSVHEECKAADNSFQGHRMSSNEHDLFHSSESSRSTANQHSVKPHHDVLAPGSPGRGGTVCQQTANDSLHYPSRIPLRTASRHESCKTSMYDQEICVDDGPRSSVYIECQDDGHFQHDSRISRHKSSVRSHDRQSIGQHEHVPVNINRNTKSRSRSFTECSRSRSSSSHTTERSDRRHSTPVQSLRRCPDFQHSPLSTISSHCSVNSNRNEQFCDSQSRAAFDQRSHSSSTSAVANVRRHNPCAEANRLSTPRASSSIHDYSSAGSHQRRSVSTSTYQPVKIVSSDSAHGTVSGN
jgi:hypothetical protein